VVADDYQQIWCGEVDVSDSLETARKIIGYHPEFAMAYDQLHDVHPLGRSRPAEPVRSPQRE
jgi:hypothetical protein